MVDSIIISKHMAYVVDSNIKTIIMNQERPCREWSLAKYHGMPSPEFSPSSFPGAPSKIASSPQKGMGVLVPWQPYKSKAPLGEYIWCNPAAHKTPGEYEFHIHLLWGEYEAPINLMFQPSASGSISGLNPKQQKKMMQCCSNEISELQMLWAK